MGFINQQGLNELANYKYKSGGYSWLDYKLNPFWEWCAKRLPASMAPNLVTFTGFVFIVGSYALMLFYDINFSREIPNWIFYASAVGVFIYQTLDAIDGKHARNTKSSSPLGQLFDHGCDSFSLSFCVLMYCQSCLIQYEWVFYILIVNQGLSYFSNLMQRHTGVLTTQVNNFGVTQIELILVALFAVTGYTGQLFWSQPLAGFVPGFIAPLLPTNKITQYILEECSPSSIVKWINVFLTGLLIYVILSFIITNRNNLKAILKDLLPFVILQVLQIIFYLKISFFKEISGLILISFGMIFSLICCKLITCSVTKMDFPLFHLELALLAIFTIAIFIVQSSDPVLAKYIFMVYSVVNIVSIGYWLHSTINQITRRLGIYCFSLKKRKQE